MFFPPTFGMQFFLYWAAVIEGVAIAQTRFQKQKPNRDYRSATNSVCPPQIQNTEAATSVTNSQ